VLSADSARLAAPLPIASIPADLACADQALVAVDLRVAAPRRVVALVCEVILPFHQGGREHRYHELTKRISDHADIHVFTMHWWDGPRIRQEGGITYHAISRLIPLYVKQRRSLRQAFFFAVSCLRLLRYDFDVLCADNIPFLQLFVLRLVTLIKRKRLVVTWHEVWGREYWRQYLGVAGILAWFVELIAMRMPDEILAASPQTADRLRASLGNKRPISLAIHGIDLDTVESVSSASRPTDIAVVGRLMEHKRVDMLLDAIAKLHADGFPVTCRIIGDGPERDALHKQAESLGIAESVAFLHDISDQKDVYSTLKAARVCVFPSAREGFGVGVVEALACGVPVITTSAPDNLAQHLVQRSDRGTVCDPSADAIASAVKDVLANSNDGQQHATPESWLREFSWDSIARQFSEALGL
jgi:glycosyltransferase involved in cell wall biosynthesis